MMKMEQIMRNMGYRLWCGVVLLVAMCMVACGDNVNSGDDDSFVEKEAVTVTFTNADVTYLGDYTGEGNADGWLIKLYTDMEIDELGNLIGPGSAMQLLLNAPYEESQTPNLSRLISTYSSQQNSGDFRERTFVWGYSYRLDLPGGFVELSDGTFYASIPEGSTEMDIDLLDDGKITIERGSGDTFTIKGSLVGKQCRKRNFKWSGEIEPKSEAEPEGASNSTLKSDLALTTLTKMQIQDKGDSFYCGNESYRNFLLFIVEEDMEFEWGKPKGSGEVLRLELLVPWDTDITQGVPQGEYTMMTRNADTSFDKSDIVPFRVVSGLPDRFSYPYWGGSWYVSMVYGGWGENYARIDEGVVVVERGEDGSHHIVCTLRDCSSPSYAVTAEVTIASENVIIY